MKKILLNIFITIGGILIILLTATILVTKTRNIYYYSIDNFYIEEDSNIPKEEIVKNYSYIIEFLFNNEKEFELPTIKYSEDGATHFKEVKKLYFLGEVTVIVDLFAIIGLIFLYNKEYRDFLYLKCLGISSIAAPIGLTLLVNRNFDFFFITFHKIFFKNDKWLFNPITDPIITILPEEFFSLVAMGITAITIFVGVIILIIYKNIIKSTRLVYSSELKVNK